jgi:hypothetical protein
MQKINKLYDDIFDDLKRAAADKSSEHSVPQTTAKINLDQTISTGYGDINFKSDEVQLHNFDRTHTYLQLNITITMNNFSITIQTGINILTFDKFVINLGDVLEDMKKVLNGKYLNKLIIHIITSVILLKEEDVESEYENDDRAETNLSLITKLLHNEA